MFFVNKKADSRVGFGWQGGVAMSPDWYEGLSALLAKAVRRGDLIRGIARLLVGGTAAELINSRNVKAGKKKRRKKKHKHGNDSLPSSAPRYCRTYVESFISDYFCRSDSECCSGGCSGGFCAQGGEGQLCHVGYSVDCMEGLLCFPLDSRCRKFG